MNVLIIFDERNESVHLIEKSITEKEFEQLTRFQDHYINEENGDYALSNEMIQYFYGDEGELQLHPRTTGVIVNAKYDYIFFCGCIS